MGCLTQAEAVVPSDDRFRVLFENAADPHFVIADGVIVDCNGATVSALGLASKAAVLQMRPSTLSPLLQPDGRLSNEKSIEMDALAFARGMHRFEWVHRKADGSTFPVQVTLNAVQWDERPALIAVWHDLSAVRQREQDLRETNAKLVDAHAALTEAHAALAEEMDAVGRIQRLLLPRQLPVISTLALAADYRTSSRAGGDYYDLFDLESGRWGIFVADVSGHGTPAAVIMAVTHALAHAYPGPTHPPGLLLCHLNNALWQGYACGFDGGGASFVTAFYGVYDANTRILTHARAGHPQPRLYRQGRVCDLAGDGGLPLGILSDSAGHAYPQTTTQLQPDDMILFYTDGITEARSHDGTFFGYERLDLAFADCQPTGSPAAVVEAITTELASFSSLSRPADDQTLLVAIVR